MKTKNNINKKAIVKKLLHWWEKNKDPYPWREDKDPYKILVAEILLQRTKADQVLPIYLKFIEKYRNFKDLAQADPSEVENYIRPLGLSWRAKKLIEAAKTILERWNGTLPAERDALLSIPGVNEYIADAVLSFIHDVPTAIVDANTARIAARIMGIPIRGELRRNKKIRIFLQELVPKKNHKQVNLALIDLGRKVCVPRKPLCSSCPIKKYCKFYLGGNLGFERRTNKGSC